MLLHRTTKDIVLGWRRREEAAQPTEENPQADKPDGNTANENRTEDITMETKVNKLNPKYLQIAGIAACIILLALVLIFFSSSQKERIELADGMSVVALPDTALADSIDSGDIIQIYAADGAVIPQLRYVQVCGSNESGLLLSMEPIQVAAFAQHETVTAALVTQSGEQAVELLAQQWNILHPGITLQLSRNITLKPGEAWTPDLIISTDPIDGVIPSITWTSSDPSICSVADGVITANTLGKAVITVSCGDATATCTVEVRIPLAALQLSAGEAQLAVGETVQLTASPDPQDATDFKVLWTSDNPAVATVTEDGLVTAVSGGTATITASCGDITAACTVKVGVHTELVQLSQHDITLAPTETLVLQWAISPAENNLDSVIFTSSDPETVSVAADGTVTALKEGTVTITITVGKATDTCSVTVTAAKK